MANPRTRIQLTSQPVSYDGYLKADKSISKAQIINSLVGNLQRLKLYPKLGYQIAEEIPAEVWSAYDWLVDQS